LTQENEVGRMWGTCASSSWCKAEEAAILAIGDQSMRVGPFSEAKKDGGAHGKEYGFPGREPADLQVLWRKNATMKHGTHIGTKAGQSLMTVGRRVDYTSKEQTTSMHTWRWSRSLWKTRGTPYAGENGGEQATSMENVLPVCAGEKEEHHVLPCRDPGGSGASLAVEINALK